MVAPLAGAWIETFEHPKEEERADVAPLAGAWIETNASQHPAPPHTGRVLAGTWINGATKYQRCLGFG